eukprot:236335-Prorocentrum_minimum.AAC.1
MAWASAESSSLVEATTCGRPIGGDQEGVRRGSGGGQEGVSGEGQEGVRRMSGGGQEGIYRSSLDA